MISFGFGMVADSVAYWPGPLLVVKTGLNLMAMILSASWELGFSSMNHSAQKSLSLIAVFLL